jgi:mannose-6-phosphate isomerase class I
LIQTTTYDKHPYIAVGGADECAQGWDEIVGRLTAQIRHGKFTIAIECYPGVFDGEIIGSLEAALRPTLVIRTADAFRPQNEIASMVGPLLTDDPVFGRLGQIEIADFLAPEKQNLLQQKLAANINGLALVVGAGAALLAPHADLLIYADLARWTIQQRHRRNEIDNLGANNRTESAGMKYKRGFFVDWRAADRLKRRLFDRISFLLDTNIPHSPRMIAGDAFRHALGEIVRRPFRVVPFFDPGPWGGRWMMDRFDLPRNEPNYAWCFDCVPEENSLLLGFGNRRVEIPAIDVVFRHPRELLGDRIYRQFGAEFPIRFDFLDTIGGGNLSLQVHPLRSYIRQHFGMSYTQDESYYLLDAAEGAVVYLGLKEATNRARMERELREAQEDGGKPFVADQYVNCWPARKHDHFAIPAGTIHCSGRNCLVLEISATPYIFTFKLWDWGRFGLDGKPRPIHLEHGLANIQWDRTTNWVRENLVNPRMALGSGAGWREERTGLHSLEFIETRRHWFTGAVMHDTRDTVNVLNLVEGPEAVVESPHHAFDPFIVHYAETFIVPAAVGPYCIRPVHRDTTELATIKAFVRE